MMTDIFLKYVLMACGLYRPSTDHQSPHGVSPVAAELPRGFCFFPLWLGGRMLWWIEGKEETKQTVSSDWDLWWYAFCLEGASDLEWQGSQKAGSLKDLLSVDLFFFEVLEALYRLQWTSADGLGVLIISPTRELAYQTFEVLRKVGKNHDFSAGLIIGGKVCLFILVLLSFFPCLMLEHCGSWPGSWWRFHLNRQAGPLDSGW